MSEEEWFEEIREKWKNRFPNSSWTDEDWREYGDFLWVSYNYAHLDEINYEDDSEN
jgi:hypothetical protein